MTLRILTIVSMALGATGWFGIAANVVRGTSTASDGPSVADLQAELADGGADGMRASIEGKIVLGPTVIATEAASGLDFLARVDTGARTCSIHAEEINVESASPMMQENIGKMVRFRTANRRGESAWLERPVADVRWIKTSERGEWRYIVPLTLACEGTRKEVLVSLNERSHMAHALLVGRNLLAGKFLVDVGQ